ncbi:MAG: ATPase, partial [Gemmatimonadota bacterium]
LDLSALEQIVEEAQVRGIAWAMVYASAHWFDGRRTMREALTGLMEELRRRGLKTIDERQPGDLATFRIYELAAALARLRTLRVHEKQESTTLS